ncbi:hypothetical protein KXD40_000447 [Peronospora effusa]|nr:hypothetical protein KXD40_000447 [Peronospora effusa]
MNPVLLSKVKAINSRMDYTVFNNERDTVADVAYDLFTSSTPRGKKENEIMIWLAAIGERRHDVYSFVATQQVSAFSGNLMEFFQYVKLNTNQYLIKVECGTEPFVGTNVTLKVSHYSATIVTA